MAKVLPNSNLPALFELLASNGYRVVAPRNIAAPAGAPDLAARFPTVTPTLTGKNEMFPIVETIMRYRTENQKIQLVELESTRPRTVLFGTRPCDARAFLPLDAVFGWDYQDRFYQSRRAATTIVTIACESPDDHCFCTSVGGSPSDPTGSDILLATSGEGFAVQVITEKGRAVADLASRLLEDSANRDDPLTPTESAASAAPNDSPPAFDLQKLSSRLPGLFNNEPLWLEQSLACLGCGTCTYLCPVCSCFDMQDDSDLKGGVRQRCWDSCAFGLFTIHASGHNPRPKQSVRWRQRIMHKFSYMPERLGHLGCVGCGRCSRACPAGVSLKQNLIELAETEA